VGVAIGDDRGGREGQTEGATGASGRVVIVRSDPIRAVVDNDRDEPRHVVSRGAGAGADGETRVGAFPGGTRARGVSAVGRTLAGPGAERAPRGARAEARIVGIAAEAAVAPNAIVAFDGSRWVGEDAGPVRVRSAGWSATREGERRRGRA